VKSLSKNDSYFRKEFVIAFIIVFALSAIFEIFGMNEGYVAPSQQVNETITWISEMRQTATWFNIFSNNIMIAYLGAIPIVGFLFYLFTSYNTGIVYGNLGQYYNLSLGQTYSLDFTNPIGILEEVAMTLLIAESILIVYLLIKDREEVKERIMVHSWKSFIICTVLLFIGAVIEAWLINIS
jgi:uncharacterized membrane protein SpoIIM required for sporulation